MLDVFIFTYIKMPMTGRKKAFCVLEYARSQLTKTVQHTSMRDFSKTVANRNAYLDMAQKIQKRRLFVQEKRICTVEHVLAKPKEIVRKKKSGRKV